MDGLLALTARAEAVHFWFRGFRRFVSPILAEVTGGRTGLRLLDCGCGTGHNLDLLRSYGTAYGFDLSPFGASSAGRGGNRVVRADITRIPFASESFDVATAFDVLQCVPEDAAAIAEMARVVRRGGTVVLTVAALGVLRGDHADAWGEVRRYTPRSARRLVEGAGLVVERLAFLFASLFPLMLAVRTGQRLLRPWRGLRPDADITVPPAPVNAALAALVAGEAALARRGLRLPIGSSLLVVARKGRV
ncbi:MAG TPA: class I SAM-dependent methyltransferase [Vicinamibacterales bacterium]|nr:class I SAM-dependent methyltransferase [Vicinamibacterales bacterium]